MKSITITKRDPSVKAKRLRRLGFVPCVIYGGSLKKSLSVQVDGNVAKQLLRKKCEGSKVELIYEEKIIPVLIKSLEHSIVGDEVIHISFQALETDKRVNGKAQLLLSNKDKSAGVLEQVLFEVMYAIVSIGNYAT